MRKLRHIAFAAFVLTTFGLGSGCAQTRDEIIRVQALAIRKADLVGDYRKPGDAPDFYMRGLILGVHRTNPWVSDGLQDLTGRIRFEIQEDELIARNAYEYIVGADGKGGARGKTNNGNIVGIWKIQSHFDVRRDYNMGTGEEFNVLDENTTDRPWYDREYIRVDWSQNLVPNPNTILYGQGIKWRPVSFFERENTNEEYRSNFAEIGSGYFDVTSRWIASPMADDEGVPYCLYKNFGLAGGAYVADPSIDCGDQEVTMRTAFWKVPTGDQSTDYEVGEVQASDGDIVGSINLDRSGYDRNYGIVDNNWHQYMQRYNIWQKSHTGDVCGAEATSAAAANAECTAAVGVNSHCDMNVKLCTLPMKERSLRPIVWYLDPALPEFFYPATQAAIDEWNVAIKRGISYAREVECRKEGESREACHEQFFEGPVDPTKEDVAKLADGEAQAVLLCHNPVIAEDDKACGGKGKKVRRGDIRYHMVAWWSNPSFESPLGVIVPGGDPTTGEHIGTMANVFGATVTNYAARVRDQIMLVNGDITPAEYVSGITVNWYANELPVAQNGVPGAELILNGYLAKLSSRHAGVNMSAEEVAERVKAVDVKALSDAFGATQFKDLPVFDRMKAWSSYVEKQSTLGAPNFRSYEEYAAKLSQKFEKLKKTGTESAIVNNMWLSGAGIDPSVTRSDKLLNLVSPLRGASNLAFERMVAAREAQDEKLNRCFVKNPMEQLSFTFISGISAKLKARYPDGATATGEAAERAQVSGQKIDRVVRGKIYYQELLKPIYELTLIHEIGHLMSMNHDFSGSYDSPNFHPEYWTLRAHGKVENMAECKTARAPGSPDTCAGPRWLDPITDEELGIAKGNEYDSIDSFANASVMDYKPDDRFGAVHLGTYDKMAAKFIYGRVIELIDEKTPSAKPKETAQVVAFNGAIMNSDGWIRRENGSIGLSQDYVGLARDMNAFDPARCRPQTPEEREEGVGALGLTCQPAVRDHAGYDDMKNMDVGVTIIRGSTKEQTPRYRWPYKMGNGRTGYVHQAVFDNGADFYELTNDVIQLNNLDYLGFAFRKEARESGVMNAVSRRTFARVQQLQWNALSDVVRNGTGLTSAGSDGQIIALTKLFDAMAEALLRPQPGKYVLDKQPGSLFDLYSNPESDVASPAFSIGLGDARFIESAFDLTKQYDYRTYGLHAGSFLDKPNASVALTDARPQLSTISRETYVDGRNVMFSFRSAIPLAFDRLVAGVMADDWDSVAPYVDPAKPADAFGNAPLQSLKLWEQDLAKITRPANARIVDPLLGFNIKVPAMVLMLLYQPIDTNMELLQRTRIWQPGLAEAVDVPDSEKVVFFDPVDQTEWNARSFGTERISGKIVEKGVGARMLQHANELLLAAYNVNSTEIDAGTGQRAVTYVGRRPTGALTVKNPAAAAKLTAYVAFLNQVRAAMVHLGYGPCGRGEEC